MKKLKLLTYIITDTAGLKELKENLIDVRDKFSKHAPWNHRIEVQHPMAKIVLEENVKRKLQSVSLPPKK